MRINASRALGLSANRGRFGRVRPKTIRQRGVTGQARAAAAICIRPDLELELGFEMELRPGSNQSSRRAANKPAAVGLSNCCCLFAMAVLFESPVAQQSGRCVC